MSITHFKECFEELVCPSCKEWTSGVDACCNEAMCDCEEIDHDEECELTFCGHKMYIYYNINHVFDGKFVEIVKIFDEEGKEKELLSSEVEELAALLLEKRDHENELECLS